MKSEEKLVEDHNLSGLRACAQLMRPANVMFAGGVHNSKGGQEGLQI